jgi:hypothetical protein
LDKDATEEELKEVIQMDTAINIANESATASGAVQ